MICYECIVQNFDFVSFNWNKYSKLGYRYNYD